MTKAKTQQQNLEFWKTWLYRTHHFRIMIYDLGGIVMTPVKIEYSQLKDFKYVLVLRKKKQAIGDQV